MPFAVWALLLSLLLGACSGAPPLPDHLRHTLKHQVQLPVPFIAQQAYYCAPAAVASIARYRQLEVDQQHVAAMSFLPGRQGSLTLDVQAASRRLGLLPYPLPKRFTALLTEIDAGNPVLVLQNLGLSWLPQWHYAVVVGYNLDTQTLLLHSGEHANYPLAFSTFHATWRRAEQWARVLVGENAMPATAQPLVYMRSANAFEETGHREKAEEFYRAASERWPSHYAPWLARANLAYAQGNMVSASRLYRQAIQQQPDNASLWNNYSYALAAQQCASAAQTAVAHALRLAPGDSNIAASQQELRTTPQGEQHCDDDRRFLRQHVD